jgi:hypothetical protein
MWNSLDFCSPKRSQLTRNFTPTRHRSFLFQSKFTNWRNTMRQSASRIRSLANRYALAEAAAFPGIGTECVRLPDNRRPAAEFRHSFPRFAHQM